MEIEDARALADANYWDMGTWPGGVDTSMPNQPGTGLPWGSWEPVKEPPSAKVPPPRKITVPKTPTKPAPPENKPIGPKPHKPMPKPPPKSPKAPWIPPVIMPKDPLVPIAGGPPPSKK